MASASGGATFEQRVLSEFDLIRASHSRIEEQLDQLGLACDRLLQQPDQFQWKMSSNKSSAPDRVALQPVLPPLGAEETSPSPHAPSSQACGPDLEGLASPRPRFSKRITDQATSPRERPMSETGSANKMQHDLAMELPMHWPASIKLRPEFAKKAAMRHFIRSDGLMVFSVRKTASESSDGLEKRLMVEDEGRRSCTARLAIDPNSKGHMLYNALSLVVLFFDLTVLPFTLAWDISVSSWQVWVPTSFWTIDICMNFFIGFYKADRLVMDLQLIARSYMRSWLAFDSSLVMIDYLAILMDVNKSVKFFRFAKIGRVLRLVGLVRMLRLVRIVERIAETHLSQGSRLLFTVSRYFVAILWFSHLLSCCWFGVGRSGISDTGGSWFYSVPVRGDGWIIPYDETGIPYQYLTALNWAVGQIALGPVEAYPQNVFERVFSVLATMIGFLFGSTLVSSLSAAMVDYQMSKKDKVAKMRSLRCFLQQHHVTPRLSTLVTRQAEGRLAMPETMREADVPALALLSATLRAELKMAIMRPHLELHPVFSLWLSIDEEAMQRICFEAVHSKYVRPAEELFAAGVEATSAHYLIHGLVSYEQEAFTSQMSGMVSLDVEPGSWIAEAALWTKWIHVGKARASLACDLMSISAKDLAQSTAKSFALEQIAVDYGKQYHKRVVNAKPPHSPYPTDLEVASTDFHDIVVTMGREIQVFIGVQALNHCKHGPSNSKRMQLKEEVTKSKCTVVLTPCGMLLRVVSLVVLDLRRANGNVLAQVGKLEGQTFKPACELPGLKQGHNEVVSEALNRLLETKKLRFIADKVELESFTSETMQKESKEFSVQTRYCRNKCSAKLKHEAYAELDLPICAITHQTSETDDTVPDSLRGRPVFVAQDSDRYHLYAWLTEREFSFLSGPGGERVLDEWLQSVEIPRDPDLEEETHSPIRHDGEASESNYSLEESPTSTQQTAAVFMGDLEQIHSI